MDHNYDKWEAIGTVLSELICQSADFSPEGSSLIITTSSHFASIIFWKSFGAWDFYFSSSWKQSWMALCLKWCLYDICWHFFLPLFALSGIEPHWWPAQMSIFTANWLLLFKEVQNINVWIGKADKLVDGNLLPRKGSTRWVRIPCRLPSDNPFLMHFILIHELALWQQGGGEMGNSEA